MSKTAIMYFTATWCGACEVMLPVAEKVAVKHKKELEVVDITTGDGQQSATLYGVTAIPQLICVNKDLPKDEGVLSRLIGVGKVSDVKFA
jgi:thiol-disulfide isomerase/thioredoxin